MGKILDLTPISDTAQLPLKKGTLQFLQDAYNGNFFRILQAISSTNTNFQLTDVYVLYGCINTGVYPNYNISAGVVLYGLQIFDVPATTFTVTGANIAVASLTQTQYTTNADPVTLTDSTVVNVHNEFGIQIAAGASGSGLKNYSDFIFNEFSIYEEKLNRQSADASLQSSIDLINAGWSQITLDGTNVSATGGTISSISSGLLSYKIIGKTGFIRFGFTSTLASTPNQLAIDCSSFFIDNFENSLSSRSIIYAGGLTSSEIAQALTAGSDILIQPIPSGNFIDGTSNIRGSITVEFD